MKWRISCMCPEKNRFNNEESNSPQMHDLQKTDSSLLTSEHLSRISHHPQANEFNCFDSGWTSLSLHFLPINAAQPKPSMVSCVACYSMHLSNWFLCYSWVNSILCNSSLPQFTSLFGLTEATSKIFSISSSISLTIRKGLRNFHSRISMKLGLAEPQSWETG